MSAYGATREEWAHFSQALGLTADLLPVVSNPTAAISPDSSLSSVGKVPSRYNAQHQVVGMPRWTEHRSTPQEVKLWAGVPDYGICIQARTIRAIDVDLDDRDACGAVCVQILEHLGPLPLRAREGSERALFVFRCDGPLEKRVIRRTGGQIELLADGQQFVAAGTHPKGGRYHWSMGLPTEIPAVPRETLDALWEALGGNSSSSGKELLEHAGARSPNQPTKNSVGHELDPVIPWLETRGWIRTGRSADGSFPIWCPWAIDHTSDSGPSETVYWPAGTGGYLQGHFKCLHAHCDTRDDNDFLTAIGFAQSFEAEFEVLSDTPEPHTEPQEGRSPDPAPVTAGEGPDRLIPAAWLSAAPGMGLKRGRKGWSACLENVTRAVDTEGFWLRLGYDAFKQELVSSDWRDPLGEESWTALENRHLIEGRQLLGRAGFEPIGRELMRDSCELVAHSRRFDTLELWLMGRRWDGTLRVGTFLQDYYGAADSPYVRAVNDYWWTALAGRALEPGAKADMVPILVGPQGIGKTRSLESLAPWPEAYRTVDLAVRDAELARRMRGACVLELNELRGLHSRARTAINSFITERFDVWRPLYQEFDVIVPRRGIFIGTTNDDAFLDDETGNRRWLPIAVTGFGELTAAVRDQLWAEGAARFLADGISWRVAEMLGRSQHDDFRIVDAWEDPVWEWLKYRSPNAEPFTLTDLAGSLGMQNKEISRAVEMRLAKILKAGGYVRVRLGARDSRGSRRWGWHLDLPAPFDTSR